MARILERSRKAWAKAGSEYSFGSEASSGTMSDTKSPKPSNLGESSRDNSFVGTVKKNVGSGVVQLRESANSATAGFGDHHPKDPKTERELEKRFKDTDLFAVASNMRESIEIKSRIYGTKRYPDCFIGYEAAQWMIDVGLCEDTQEAVFLGNLLVNAGLVFHVLDEHDFRADKKLFYHFHIDQIEFAVPQGAELEALKFKFKDYVTVHTKYYHMKAYKEVFVGTEAVDIMLQKGMANSRKHAVAIGAALCEQGLFHHVVYDHTFKDENLFYKYSE